jgi:hypothetical protein
LKEIPVLLIVYDIADQAKAFVVIQDEEMEAKE